MAILTVRASGGIYTLSQLQTAIDAAVDGDTIAIQAGQQILGSFILRNKGVLVAGITITSDGPIAFLPAAGTRTAPGYSPFMAQVKSSGGGANTFYCAPGANGWTLRHLDLPNVPFGHNAIVALGTNDSTQEFLSQMPYNLTIDRCWLHGGKVCGQHHAIELNSGTTLITNNYFEEIKAIGQDCSCIQGSNGTGPYTVTNNYMRGGTEPFLLGGADPAMRTLLTVTASTTTTASVTCLEGGHTLAELTSRIGQGIGVPDSLASGGYAWTTLRSVTGTGTSGSIGFDAVARPPTVAGTIKSGVIASGLIFQRNYVSNDPVWKDEGALSTPTGLTATPVPGGGTLPAGTYYYSVQGKNTTEPYVGDPNNGYGRRCAEVSATLSAPGRIDVQCNGVPGADFLVFARGTTPNSPQFIYAQPFGSTGISDTGSLTWVRQTPHASSEFQIKNLFELKAVRHAQIDSNIFENSWLGVDVGYAIWLKTVNQDGNAPWLQTFDVTFEENIVRHVCGFLEVHGRERKNGGSAYPGVFDGLVVRNNLVYDSNQNWGNDHYAISASAVYNFVLDHNTIIHSTTLGAAGDSGGTLQLDNTELPMQGFVCTNNMLRRERYGIFSQDGEGLVALNGTTTGGYTLNRNALADADASLYGGSVSTFAEADAAWRNEFVNFTLDGVGADYHLKSSSVYHNTGTDGKDLGCDIDLVLAATADVISGVPSGQPPTIPTSPTPADGSTNVGTSVVLAWAGSGAASYDLYFGTSPVPPLVSSAQAAAFYSPAALANGTSYYWKVVARNSVGFVTGPVWSFMTVDPPSGQPHKFHGRFRR